MNDSLFYLTCAKIRGGRGRVAGSEAIKRMDALIWGRKEEMCVHGLLGFCV